MMFRKMSDIAVYVNSILSINKDYTILSCGDEGDGKSTLSAQLGKCINPRTFNFRDSIVYTDSIREYNEKYAKLKEGGAMQIDEAGKLMYSLDFARAASKIMVKKWTADQRKEKHSAYILCAAQMSLLQKYWKGHRIKMWLECMPREWYKTGWGAAMVFRRDRSPFGMSDPWLLDKYNKEWMKKIKHGRFNPEARVRFLQLHPYYAGEVLFKPLKKREQQAYEINLSLAKTAAANLKEVEGLSSMANKYRQRLVNITHYLINERGWKQDDVAKAIGMNRTTLSVMLNVNNSL